MLCQTKGLPTHANCCNCINNLAAAERRNIHLPEGELHCCYLDRCTRLPKAEHYHSRLPTAVRRRNRLPKAEHSRSQADRRTPPGAHNNHMQEGSTQRAPDTHTAGDNVSSSQSS